jgi:hypothetical protein
MRYLVLLLLCSFGAFLLLVANNRYHAVNEQLARLNTVEGAVESIGPDGDLHVKYTVGSTAYEVVRSVPVKLPRIRAGDPVTLVYSPDRPDTARVKQWSVIYQDSAVAGAFGVAALLMAIVAFLFMGAAARITPTAPGIPLPAIHVTLDRPIELRNTGRDFATTLLFAAIVFAAAFLISRYPYFLWFNWMSYALAGLVAIAGAFIVWGAFDNKSLRILADDNGVLIRSSEGTRQFSWRDVAALKRETVVQIVQHESLIKHTSTKQDFSYTEEEVGHYLILLDSAGKELLKLDEDTPMNPVQDWALFRAYIPQRTELPVQQESSKSPLGVVKGF